MMLSILSCVCWQSVYLLWRNVYLGPPPIFGFGCLFFWYWAAWAACIFWRLILCQLLCLQIFSLILRVVFFTLMVLLATKFFNADEVQFIYFFLWLLVPLESYLGSLCLTHGYEDLNMFPSKGFIVLALTFRTMIYFKVISVYDVKGPNFIHLYVDV